MVFKRRQHVVPTMLDVAVPKCYIRLNGPLRAASSRVLQYHQYYFSQFSMHLFHYIVLKPHKTTYFLEMP